MYTFMSAVCVWTLGSQPLSFISRKKPVARRMPSVDPWLAQDEIITARARDVSKAKETEPHGTLRSVAAGVF